MSQRSSWCLVMLALALSIGGCALRPLEEPGVVQQSQGAAGAGGAGGGCCRFSVCNGGCQRRPDNTYFCNDTAGCTYSCSNAANLDACRAPANFVPGGSCSVPPRVDTCALTRIGPLAGIACTAYAVSGFVNNTTCQPNGECQ